jgi:hypothetical protein
MKKSLFSAMFSAFALMALQATATPVPSIHGPLTIDWTLNQQKIFDAAEYAGSGKTSVSGSGTSKATNVLQIYKYSSTTVAFNNAKLLDLLENSLKTTFPAGTKLATDGANLYVVDSTGTNVIADITSIVTLTTTNEVISGLETSTTTSKKSGTNSTAVGTSSGSQVVIVKYDDSALKTTDGTTTTFTFIGVSAFTDSGSSTTSTNDVLTGKESGSFTIHGDGYGNIRDQASIIEGTIVGSPAGTYSFSLGVN